MVKEHKEEGQEATLESVAEKAKEVLLRDNYHPSKIYFSGSIGSNDVYASADWQEVRDLGRDAIKEFPVGELKKVFVVFRGFFGRLGREADTTNESEKGLDAIRIKDAQPNNSVGFEPWAANLREVLAVAGGDVGGKKIRQVLDEGEETVIYEIVRNENGDAISLKEIYKGQANVAPAEAFVWGYTDWSPNRKLVSPD